MDCAGFSNFDFPEGLESIGDGAFGNCAENAPEPLAITIPSTVTSIEEAAFYHCKAQEVKILSLDSLTIGPMAFMDIDDLTTITLQAKLKSLKSGSQVFGHNGVSKLEKVYNHSENPLEINHIQTIFSDNILLENVTLYVPEASIDAYRVANVWKDFGAIEAINATAVPALKTAESVYCYIANNALTVKGLTGTATLTLTGLNGKTLLRKTVSSDVSIPLNGLSKGVYVVRIGDKAHKIIINH